MKLNKLLIIALAVTMFFGSTSTILAKGGRGPHPMDLTRFIEELDLSEEQKVQVEAIIDKYEDDKDSLVESLKEAREKVSEVIFAEEFNEAAVRAAIGEVSPIMEELVVLHAKIIAELRTVLTPEQIGYLKGRMEAMKEFRGHRRDREGQ